MKYLIFRALINNNNVIRDRERKIKIVNEAFNI